MRRNATLIMLISIIAACALIETSIAQSLHHAATQLNPAKNRIASEHLPLTILPILVVLLGGAIGCVCRFVGVTMMAYFFNHHKKDIIEIFPHHTLFVNMLGCFLMGILSTLFVHHHVNLLWNAAILVGFLGGLTTVSSFSLEVVNLFKQQRALHAMFYIVIAVGLGGLLEALGAVIVGGY